MLKAGFLNRDSRPRSRRGSVLVEFALVSLVLYLLLAAILTFGLMLYSAQGVQQAIDLAAREISRAPLPANDLTLEEVLQGDANATASLADVRRQIYDEHYLVLNLDTLHGRPGLQELIGDLPVVNRQLVPLMVFDEVEGTRVLRYPGAVFQDTNASDNPADPPASGYLVAIPLVVARDGDGVETVDWVPVFEEIDSAANPEPFQLSSPQRGIVALRLNYPYQAAGMSSFQANPAGPFEPTIGQPNVANDAGVQVVDEDGFTPQGTPTQSDLEYGPYTGSFGLGQQAALGSQQMTGTLPVRPFRRVISAQAIYRREVFTP
jgi:hypothetical protein